MAPTASTSNQSRPFPEFEDDFDAGPEPKVMAPTASTSNQPRAFPEFEDDFDDDQNEDTADEETEGGDTFAADNFGMKVTSARAAEPRRSSLSTEMLVCVEAEGALDQAIMAADLALERRTKGSSSADFRAEI